jgi:quercetin 2,3-dioxygenase
MLTVRRSLERGYANHGWLESYHSFSFASYYDSNHMGFRELRVINEDTIAAGQGFGTHPHQNMEIITYVLDGAIAHKDSMGNGSTILPGDVQRMSAGTGITHSEFNPADQQSTHMLQIWIEPETQWITPSYEQKTFPAATKQGQFRLIASRDGRDDSVTVHQDMNLYAALLEPEQAIAQALNPDRHYWMQVARGSVNVNGTDLDQGDAIALTAETQLTVIGRAPSEILLFDLA